MIDYGIKEYVRLMGSVSLSKEDKERLAELIMKERLSKKYIPKKYVAAASVFAFLAVGAVIAVKGMR